MRESDSSQAIERDDTSKPATRFAQPDNCSVAVCSAIAMYERELERHRATESSLRESILRESDLLRQRDELILQKDILAKESEHRLLNGLQLIKSVLAMQSRNTSNSEAAAQLSMAANRVSTLARVHQHLHAMDALESVEFKQYLERLCHDLSDMVSSDSAQQSLCVEGAELTIPRVTATPLALIASELITNSIKYAKGKITVSLQSMPNSYAALSVSDDGPGLPEPFDPAATTGLGMKIVSALAKQILGELKSPAVTTAKVRDLRWCSACRREHSDVLHMVVSDNGRGTLSVRTVEALRDWLAAPDRDDCDLGRLRFC